ncbi:MAG: hypothetical protein K8J31_00330, partial [Anaerolineae bacterium]|nr:hypothetical protein [Anaerolineae bacterium]
MQAVTDSYTPAPTRPGALALSYEWIAYGMLIALALALRIAELDSIPLTNREAAQALAAWRALHPALPGSVIVPESPLLFLLHGFGFSIFGGTEFAARLFT